MPSASLPGPERAVHPETSPFLPEVGLTEFRDPAIDSTADDPRSDTEVARFGTPGNIGEVDGFPEAP